MRSFAATFLVSILAMGAGRPDRVSAQETASSQPSQAVRYRVAALSREAADLMRHGKLAQAEKVLDAALALHPADTTCRYDLACVHAGQGRAEEAVADLDRATADGFTDFAQIQNNPMLAPLASLPAFGRLMGRQDEIRHAAAAKLLAALKARFGPGYVYGQDEPHRVIIAVYMDKAALDQAIAELEVLAASERELLFSHPPDQLITVLIVSPADFAKVEHRYGVAGRYDDATRTVLVKRAGPELRHEFTHALHAADQHALGEEHPVWLSEGLATLFENPGVEKGADGAVRRFIPADTWRLARVQAVARHNTIISIRSLTAMDRSAFTARAPLTYGQAASLLLYLYDHHQLKAFYDAYITHDQHDPSGLATLEHVTGTSAADLQKAWIEWLSPRPVPAGPKDDAAAQ